jgi:hypothetical protein
MSEVNKVLCSGALAREDDVRAHVVGCCGTLEGSHAWVTNCCSGSSPPTPLLSSAFRLHRHFVAVLVVSGPAKIWVVAGAAEGKSRLGGQLPVWKLTAKGTPSLRPFYFTVAFVRSR